MKREPPRTPGACSPRDSLRGRTSGRTACPFEFFLSEDARHHEAGLRTAIERYGLPRTYYVDRGAAYVADSLRVICAELGIRLVHTSPGDCEAKDYVSHCTSFGFLVTMSRSCRIFDRRLPW